MRQDSSFLAPQNEHRYEQANREFQQSGFLRGVNPDGSFGVGLHYGCGRQWLFPKSPAMARLRIAANLLFRSSSNLDDRHRNPQPRSLRRMESHNAQPVNRCLKPVRSVSRSTASPYVGAPVSSRRCFGTGWCRFRTALGNEQALKERIKCVTRLQFLLLGERGKTS